MQSGGKPSHSKMLHHTDSFLTRDNLRLFAQHWQPDGPAKARVVIVHGLVEHSGRYVETAEQFVEAGFAVSAFDLRGHGQSDGPRCLIHKFDEYVDDLLLFLDKLQEMPAPKRFVLGHSMGGLITLRAGIRLSSPGNSVKADGLIVTSPPLRVGGKVFPWLRMLAPLGSVLFPWLRLARMGGSRLSRDPQAIKAFREDPLVFHGGFPVRTGAEILRAGAETIWHAASLSLPLLLGHGTADGVCDLVGSQLFFAGCGSKDKTLCEYPGLFHAVWHEPERREIRRETIDWLRRRIHLAERDEYVKH